MRVLHAFTRICYAWPSFEPPQSNSVRMRASNGLAAVPGKAEVVVLSTTVVAAVAVFIDDGLTRSGITELVQWLKVVHFKSRYLCNRKRLGHEQVDILPRSSGLANRARRCLTSLGHMAQQLPGLLYSYIEGLESFIPVRTTKAAPKFSSAWRRYHDQLRRRSQVAQKPCSCMLYFIKVQLEPSQKLVI